MRKIDCNTSKVIIEFCVNGEKKSDIYINPSFPGGCSVIHEALAMDVELADRTLKAIENNVEESAVIDYLRGKFEVAMKLMDGIAEAIGPEQYQEISSYLPAIDINDLTALAVAIVESYCEFYTKTLKKGFRSNG